MAAVAILVTLDTKAAEADFVRDMLGYLGRSSILIDVGTKQVDGVTADITAAGLVWKAGADLAAIVEKDGVQAALEAIASGARKALNDLFAAGAVDAVIGIAGGKGSALFKDATADLPFGFPKVLVSSGRPRLLADLAQVSDTAIFPTLVDLFGLNGFTRRVLTNATRSVAAMRWEGEVRRAQKVVAITAFGVTTPAVARCIELLRQAGVEPLAFPANGAGGRLMELLVDAGEIDAVLDLTTTELADEIVGGTASAGPGRLASPGRRGIPHLVAPGAVDMVNFSTPDTIPPVHDGRLFRRHSPYTTLMRTTPAENRRIGEMAARQISRGRGSRLILFPAQGVSDYDREGETFLDLAADREWLQGIRSAIADDVELRVMDCHINDPAFAEEAVAWILGKLAGAGETANGEEAV